MGGECGLRGQIKVPAINHHHAMSTMCQMKAMVRFFEISTMLNIFDRQINFYDRPFKYIREIFLN